MTRDKESFDAEINPIHSEIRQINTPVLWALVMQIKGEMIGVVILCQITFVILTIMFIYVILELIQRNGGRRESWGKNESPRRDQQE